MKKKSNLIPPKIRHGLKNLKWLGYLVCLFVVHSPEAKCQSQKISLNLRNATMEEFVRQVKQQTNYSFFYNDDVATILYPINLQKENIPLNKLLQELLKNKGLDFTIKDRTIIIQKVASPPNVLFIKGRVIDTEAKPLSEVSIQVKGSNLGTISKRDGTFTLALPADKKDIRILFSYIGMESREFHYTGQKEVHIVMNETEVGMDEVVITGIYTRKKESFTGSSKTYRTEDLKMVGISNIIESLKTLDPAFNLIESNEYGSDPNRLPDIEIRGKSSIVGLKEKFGQDPNQPLFILDGFETTLQTIMDLNMDRVESVTILKDAASTAIYGSKAANGVVVVETKNPTSGKLRLGYNNSLNISFADLSDYNLMNAEEKLEFERLSGIFESNIMASQEQLTGRYNQLLQNVKRGVNSYWMSEPLRLGITHRHNLYVEGGDSQMRYGLGINYSGIQGVMKNSIRDIMGLSIDLIYRKKIFNFMNKLSIDWNNSNNPIVTFSEYAKTNPYYEKKSADNERWLEDWHVENISGFDYGTIRVANPLYNDMQNSYNRSNRFSIRNRFSIEIRLLEVLSIRGRMGLTKGTNESEVFTSPNATRFDKVLPLRKGTYNNSTDNSLSYDADFTITYGQLLGDSHTINIAAGTSIREDSQTTKSFSAQGFPEGNFTKPSFANQYPEGGKPNYSENKSRHANFYLNGGYSYNNRYLMDINLRSDGTSVFGVNKRFSTTWAIGVGWNLHNERFIKEHTEFFNFLKIRASIGNPGNQNFGAYSAITIYYFNNWMLNNFGTGLLASVFGDPDLEWQRTLDKNIGLDLSMFSNRFHLTFDYYHKRTDPLIANINIPISRGTSNRRANIGLQVDQGYNGTVSYAFLYNPQQRINYTMSLSFRYGKAYYDKIGHSLDQYNRENLTKNMLRYYDGASPTALWAVRSRGIDPATGKEIFVKKNGSLTYNFNYNDEVELGDTRPMLEGVWGNTLYYKGFSANLQIRYSYGADAFNTTLFNKVENISSGNINFNQDRRALYDRWKKPGDKAKFKSISLTETTPMSSRFVMKENYIAIESVRLGYQFDSQWLKKNLKISSLTISGYMNSIARFSTLEHERGLYYPFARSLSFALSAVL